MSDWLNQTFFDFDYSILKFYNILAQKLGSVLTPLLKIVTIIGEKGILVIAIALVLALFLKTRKSGVAMFLAVAIGAVITNLILKDVVGRERPFLANNDFFQWWEFAGAMEEDGGSFPSGHVTAAFGGALAFFITSKNKKISWLAFLYPIFMGISRNYLVAHYPTDVIAGILVGAISAICAYYLTKLAYMLANRFHNYVICNFFLNFDIKSCCSKNKNIRFWNMNSKKVFIKEENAIVVSKELNSINECYNTLKNNLLFVSNGGNNKIFQIESSFSSEGKTTLACNLGVSLSFNNKKVLILDLDFRKPRVHRCFKVSNELGLVDYISEKITYEQMVKHTEFENVDIVSRGSFVYNPSFLLSSDKFKELVESLRESYDFIILDSPPILQVSDYINISKVSDGVLFVVAYGRTKRSQVREASELLRKGDINVLGTVMTFVDKKDPYSYYYGTYKTEYGSEK